MLKVVPPTEWKMGLGCLPQLDRFLPQRDQTKGSTKSLVLKNLVSVGSDHVKLLAQLVNGGWTI